MIIVVGILGGPKEVANSLSPVLHAVALRESGLEDWVYVGFPVEPNGLERFLKQVGPPVAGLNVTAPHKVAAALACDELNDVAERIGAVNTIVRSDDRLIGHNTDGAGLLLNLEDIGVEVQGASVMVIGTGGAAKAAVWALATARAGSIAVVSRSKQRAQGLAHLAGNAEFLACEAGEEASRAVPAPGVVINASGPIALGEPLPVDPDVLGRGTMVLDLAYWPVKSRILSEARARGAAAHNGLGMLVHQAALTFSLWTGLDPPVEAMRRAAGPTTLKGRTAAAE